MGHGGAQSRASRASAPRRASIEALIAAGQTRSDVYEAAENEQGLVTEIKAAVYIDGCPEPLAVSEGFEVETPGDEESYDRALSQAVDNAESKVVDKLVDEEGMERVEAGDLVEVHVNRSDMPVF